MATDFTDGTDGRVEAGAGDERFAALNRLSHMIIGCAYKVGTTLGGGFLEKVYENALAHELRKAGLSVVQQFPIKITYDGVVVGEYCADMLVEGQVLLELKAAKVIDPAHMAKCLHYLTATRIMLGLIINFADRVHVKRVAGKGLAALLDDDFEEV